MQRETRRAGGGIRLSTDDDGVRYLTVRAVTPNVVDDYGSLWNPHAFDEAVARRMPTLTWGHSWLEPLGRADQYEPSDDGPLIRFRLDDQEAVPMVRRLVAQVESGTLDDVSVGFSNVTRRAPTADEQRAFPGVREVIEQADLDEVAAVLRGAVPGAKVLALRSAGGAEATIPLETVLDLGRQVAAGELSREEAVAAAQLAAALQAPEVPVVESAAGEPAVVASSVAEAVDRALSGDFDPLADLYDGGGS